MPQFRQSNKSRDFIKGDENEEQQKYYIKLGTILHSLFSSIRTTDDIEQALRQLELDGMLYDENLSRKHLDSMIRNVCSLSRWRIGFLPTGHSSTSALS